MSVVVTFDPANPLVIAQSGAQRLNLDFNLAASNRIDPTTSPITVTATPFLTVDNNPSTLKPIRVRGPLVMVGYWNKPEETAQAMRHGWLYTGDLARADADGFLYIVDRSKDMIISGGFNVYPREIEDVLTQHPAVAAAGVIGVPDEKWGEAVKALVVLRRGTSVSAEELIALVRQAKGPVQAPKSVEFVDSLPVTGLGKPDKKAIRAKYWQGQQRAIH